jgi:hypothetical protein
MKKLSGLAAGIAMVALLGVATPGLAKEITVTGEGKCGKCAMHECDKCQNVLTVTKTVKTVDGKKELTATNIELAK